MATPADDALEFDIGGLHADQIREGTDDQGVRLRTVASIERTRIPVTIDVGFGDAVAPKLGPIRYPSLLGMEEPILQAYPPAAVIAEKFQAMVALGAINGRMKDYHDLWAIPNAVAIRAADLDAAIAATFERRKTAVPTAPPEGLSNTVFDTYDAIIEAACEAWQKLLPEPQTIASIGMRQWAHVGQTS